MIAVIAGIAVVVVVIAVVAIAYINRSKSTDKAPVKEQVNDEPESCKPQSQDVEEPSTVSEPVEGPVPSEPEKEEELKAFIKPCEPVKVEPSSDVTAKKEPEINKDFMSKLVASKDASEKAAEVPYWVPPTVPDKGPEELEKKLEPMKEEPSAVAEPVEEPAAKDVGAEGPSEIAEAGDSPVDSESDIEGDTYTDYSPEALVRRAAWNKGLRCRRQYGDHAIQVAFVKPKVAVYVLGPSDVIPDEEQVRSEGWTVIRFDTNKVTDGLAEGEEIAEAVKASLHAQKSSKKKSGKK